jgi:hypothetical protein
MLEKANDGRRQRPERLGKMGVQRVYKVTIKDGGNE